MTLKIYHNPRCSKSRETLKLIQDGGVTPEVVEYLKSPPSAAELQEILTLLGVGPRALIRDKEAEFREHGLNNMDLSDDEIIAAMVAHPRLIERPIVIDGERAVVGRPPANVLELL